MRLSDVMSAAGLAFYAEVALALFMLAFVLIAVTVIARANQETFERARWLPLSNDPLSVGEREQSMHGDMNEVKP